MGIWELIGLSSGVGLLAGVRLYATVLAMGLAIRYDWITIAQDPLEQGDVNLSILAHPAVLGAAAAGCVIELLADKIAWLDSAWDAIHTFIRPIGAALLGAAAFADVDPALRAVLILLCGGVALTSHASKAAARGMVNTSPEPVSNVVVSLAEDLIVPAGIWVVFTYPLIALGVVVVFLIVFAWLSRTIWRMWKRRRERNRAPQVLTGSPTSGGG